MSLKGIVADMIPKGGNMKAKLLKEILKQCNDDTDVLLLEPKFKESFQELEATYLSTDNMLILKHITLFDGD